jgi:hypothetical protein
VSQVMMKLTAHIRGEMATKLLEAADELDLPVTSIKSQSEGFLVPEAVHRHLFPSQYAPAEPPIEETIRPARRTRRKA